MMIDVSKILRLFREFWSSNDTDLATPENVEWKFWEDCSDYCKKNGVEITPQAIRKLVIMQRNPQPGDTDPDEYPYGIN